MKQNGKVDILPAIKKGEDSYEAWFGFNQSTFGGFLFHRSALLRRISAGFTSGLAPVYELFQGRLGISC